jgi:drug/metabolite transporter (DMT)-like permease
MIPDAAAPASPAPRASHLLPVLAGLLAVVSFVLMDATIKSLTPRYDALQLTFFRFASGSVFALALWLWQRSPLPRGAAAWRMHGLRCALLLLSLVSYFHALTVLPLAQAVAISYLAPIFVSLLAVFVLRERPSRGIWFALALGLAGVVVSLWPELRAYRAEDSGTVGSARLQGIAAAALAALAFSGVMVLARLQAQRDSLWTILLVQNLLPCALLAWPAALSWRPFDAPDTLAVVWVGACATVGLLALTYAFTHMEASRVAPLEYTSFVWAALLGYTLFGEVPTAATALSAVLIVGGCLLLLRR